MSKQPAAAVPFEVGRVARVGQVGWIEAGAFVADHVNRLGGRHLDAELNAARLIRLLMPAGFHQVVVGLFVLLPQLRADLEVAVIHAH